MDSDPLSMILLDLALVLLLVFLNGFFVAAEFAFVKVRGSRIETLAQEGNLSARFAKNIVTNLNAYLSACQLGITLASLGLGWIGEPAVAALLERAFHGILPGFMVHTIAFVIAFTLITLLHITIGEQVPKTFAIRQSEKLTLWTSTPIALFYRVMYPFIWLLNSSSNWMLRRAGIEPDEEHGTVHTEEEIRLLVKESHKSGYIEKTDMALVDNIFEFGDTHAREIMIPRTEMICLYTNLSFEENKSIAIEELRTRYPVCSPDKDHIIGFLHIKDIMKADGQVKDIRQLVRPLLSVPDSIPISVLLKMMQKKRTHIVVLIDEYGGTSGMVTVEDIIEEIVGEIQDEFDQERPAIEKRDDDTYSVDGLLLIEEFNDYFGAEIPSDVYDTIGGWVYSQVEVPPRVNQKIMYEDYVFIIDEVDHMRVSRVIVRQTAFQSERLLQPG